MIEISSPEISTEGKFIEVFSIIKIDGKEDRLWYKFPLEYEKFIVTENLDAFLVGLLFLGLKSGNDITLKGAVSARLFYTLNHYVIPALVLSNNNFKPIKIFPEVLNYKNLNTEGVAGTGMSCGVDSFATYYDHQHELKDYKIQHVTFFNVGSHLDFGGEKARRIYQKRLKSVGEFTKNEGVGLIPVDSNLSEILLMNFQQTHSFRSVSCVLLLQKLFKNYYYSSAYRLDHFKLNSKDTSDFDLFNMQMLSTESTNFFASVAQFSRVERTLMVAEYPATFNRLDVCTNPPLHSNFINCSTCYKCMRTQLTLDIENKLELYNNVFDIKAYTREKERYIGSLLVKKKKSPLDYEVLDFLKKEKFTPSMNIYYYSAISIIKSTKTILRKPIN